MCCKIGVRLETMFKGFSDPALRRNRASWGVCSAHRVIQYFHYHWYKGTRYDRRGRQSAAQGQGAAARYRNWGAAVLPLEKCDVKSLSAEQDSSSPISGQKAHHGHLHPGISQL